VVTVTRRESFAVDGPVALVVRAPAGTVEVEAADGVTEATVSLEPADDGSAKAVEDTVVELRRGGGRPELVVDVQHGFRVGGKRGPRLSIVVGRGPSIAIRIRVPSGSSLDAATEASDVIGTGSFDRAEVRTASGDVRLDTIEGNATIKAVSGDVSVDRIAGEASVNSVSGDAVIGALGGPADVHSVSGDVEVRQADTSLKVKTISGDARIGSAKEGSVEMQSVSGDLTLGLRSGSRLWVDARSTSGKTRSDLDISSVPTSEERPLVELRAKSVSCDIVIVSA
jgi:hypothetical protein